MSTPSSDIAFTPTVKAIQARRGSREAYERLEQRGGFRRGITPELAAFIAGLDSVYLGTASADGQPYIQHRGGPKGFLKVLDEQTLGLADYRGNRQYITIGNLAENPRAFLFLMDYARRRRIKIWGRARTVEDDPALLARLADSGGPAAEQAILLEVEAWDINCPQHIRRRSMPSMWQPRWRASRAGSRSWRVSSRPSSGGPERP
jgi:predicted pyridoxine 5'-phosphate oxidase superfamily flavin-nucleotide-binding protein